MNLDDARQAIESLADTHSPDPARAREAVEVLLDALERGDVRSAAPANGDWVVNRWVKSGILLAFRIGRNVAPQVPPVFYFRDRDTFPVRDPRRSAANVRVVPGGTTIRRGAHLGEGVVIMPPAYVNTGAWVGPGSMIDSHALVGSCAQVGRAVHISAAVQLGGVLEPVGALPVIVEDGAFIGGGCGIYEGARVGARAVLAPGVILSRGVALYDLVRGEVHRATGEVPLVVPEGAVVVPGSRPARGSFAERHSLHVQTPVIVKYRDPSTEAAVALEEALR